MAKRKGGRQRKGGSTAARPRVGTQRSDRAAKAQRPATQKTSTASRPSPAGSSTGRPAGKTAAAGPAKTVRKAVVLKKAAVAKKAAAGRISVRKAVLRRTTKPLGPPPASGQGTLTKGTAIDRERLAVEETVPTPPSSLDMKRRGSAARTGRAELEDSQRKHRTMSPDITAGDLDVDVEDAYFTGEETPGGDNPTPDQDIVDDIGKALGVEYQDNEELKAVDKLTERDRRRWELDPASSEDYRDRK